MEDLEMQESPLQRRLNALVTVLLVFMVGLCLFVTIQVISNGYVNIAGHSLFRVVTGSMEPTIPVGSLLITDEVELDEVQVGDIICFRAQQSAIFGRMMTHRVTDIYPAADGSLLFETKGDANLVSDGYLVSQDNFVGKVIWFTGEGNILSTIFSLFTNKLGFLACIVIPCLALATLILQDCVRNVRREMLEAVRELERERRERPADPLANMTQDDRNEMYERIRAELIEELIHGAEHPKKQ